MKKEEIDNEYLKFKVEDDILIFSNQSFNYKHERYGYQFFIKKLHYDILIRNEGDIHGFDGVFIKDNKVYFYEAKYTSSSRISNLLLRANKTISNPSKTRISPIGNSIDNLKLRLRNEDLKHEGIRTEKEISISNEIEMLSLFLKELSVGKKMSIMPERSLFSLGAHNINYSKKTEEKLESIKDVLVTKYE